MINLIICVKFTITKIELKKKIIVIYEFSVDPLEPLYSPQFENPCFTQLWNSMHCKYTIQLYMLLCVLALLVVANLSTHGSKLSTNAK